MKKNLLCILSSSVLLMLGVASAGAYTFESGGVYYDINKDGTTVSVTYKDTKYASYSGDVVIPETVVYEGTTYTVTELGKYSLRNSAAMTSVSMPSTLKVIGMGAFSKCNGLKSVVIPDNVTEVGNYAIQDCPNLASLTIGKSVEKIGNGAFMGNVAMATITIPPSVTTISINAFQNCTALTEVFLPASVTTLGNNVFQGCVKLLNYKVDEANPNYCAVDGVLFSKDKKKLIAYPGGRTDEEYVVPTGVEELGLSCFCQRVISVSGHEFYNTVLKRVVLPETVTILGNSSFEALLAMESIDIPSSVTKIGNATFRSCEALKSVVIPDATVSLDLYSFKGCTALQSVVVGSSVASIAKDSFTGCSAIKSVTCKGAVPPACTKTPVFEASVTASAKLIVPKESVEAYKAADVWSSFTTIEGDDSAGVESIVGNIEGCVPTEYYTIQGVKTSQPVRGLNIVKMSDGSIRKIMINN